ncbi:HAD family hydrolase [Aquirhabdus sp.]|uniref:HAD family hydrolase n=1 Tax=Aquirhabdus sp. TaxID=2824160 RepID=UPI00396C54AA
MLNQPYDFYVFDCDGVILRSNQIKSDAFASALQGEPEQLVAEFVEYHKANGGVSRYQKFAHYYNHMRVDQSTSTDTTILTQQAIDRYAAIVRDALSSCEMISGVLTFIQKLHAQGLPCAVNSGGDELELHHVFQVRGLDQYFKHIFGSPSSKHNNMERLKSAGFMTGSGVMFGDSRSDFIAAQSFALDFVYVQEESEWKDGAAVSAAHGYQIVPDFRSLPL